MPLHDTETSLSARTEAIRRAHPSAEAAPLDLVLRWVRGGPVARAQGLAALAALPPGAALAAVGLDAVAASPFAAEARGLVVSALAGDPFREPARPLSPQVETALERAITRPLPEAQALVAARQLDEGRAPRLDGPGADRPVGLLSRAGGLAALGGIFTTPPILAPGPEGHVLAIERGLRVLTLRLDAGGAEVVRTLETPGLESAAWHPSRGLLLLGQDGRIRDEAGAEVAATRVAPPARLIVAGETIYVHGREDMRLHRLEADGRVKSGMDESAASVAIGPSGRIVALLRAPKKIASSGKKNAPTHRLVRVSAKAMDTIAMIEGEGEIALLGDLCFHVAKEDGRLTIADYASGAIRRPGRLAGAEGLTSIVVTPRAIFASSARTGHVRAYGPVPVSPEPLPATPGEALPSGTLTPLSVPAGIVAITPAFAALASGEVLRVRYDDGTNGGVGAESGALLAWGGDSGAILAAAGTPGTVTIEPGSPPVNLGKQVRAAHGGPLGDLVAVPADGSPLLHVAPGGGARPIPFPSHRVLGAVRFGLAGFALGTTDGELCWIDLHRGVLAELGYTALKAITPIGPHDVLVLHEGGLERCTHAGSARSIVSGPPHIRAIGGGVHGAIAATSAGLLALAPDGSRRAELRVAINREPMVAPLSSRAALVIPRGGTEAFLWTF